MDVTLTPDVDWERNEGILRCQVTVNSPMTGQETHCQVSVADEDGNEVATATGLDNHIKIPSVHLWQPGAAYLYEVTVKLCSGSENSVLDVYRVKTGIRTAQVKGSQFLINNEPFYFTGFGKHEDSPIRGKGHDPAYMVHDFQLIDWIGANSFRTSHYPYAEEVLNYADRQGIVVIDETAAVGLNLGVASGLFGNKVSACIASMHLFDNLLTLLGSPKFHP